MLSLLKVRWKLGVYNFRLRKGGVWLHTGVQDRSDGAPTCMQLRLYLQEFRKLQLNNHNLTTTRLQILQIESLDQEVMVMNILRSMEHS
jgi:hypothetical protein